MAIKRMTLNLLIGLLTISTPFINPIRAQEDCKQQINTAIQEFTGANFEAAIQILERIKSQPDLLQTCPPEDREKVNFYHSYCLYLLYGCQAPRVQVSICDLKLYSPGFDPQSEEYQWIAQDWISCWRQADCFTSDVVRQIFTRAKSLYNQNLYILAAQELVNFLTVTDNGATLPDGCPECGQYVDFAKEYLLLCEQKLVDTWNAFEREGNIQACSALENQFNNIQGAQDFFPKFSEHIIQKKAEAITDISNAIQNYSQELNSLMNSNEFTGINTENLETLWKKLDQYRTNDPNSQLFHLIQQTKQRVLDDFKRFGEFANRQFVIQKEERVLNAVNAYKASIIRNFPEFSEQIEQEHQKIINAPPPVFDATAFGVTPPERKWQWRIQVPYCFKNENIQGEIRCGLVTDEQGNVATVRIITRKFNVDNSCTERFIEDLIEYIKKRKFTPAFKIKHSSASAPRGEMADKETITVNYYLSKKFILK